jgi:hypothetical protein
MERPRLMITADGKHKSLWIGEQERPVILATTPVDASDAELWATARTRALKQRSLTMAWYLCLVLVLLAFVIAAKYGHTKRSDNIKRVGIVVA